MWFSIGSPKANRVFWWRCVHRLRALRPGYWSRSRLGEAGTENWGGKREVELKRGLNKNAEQLEPRGFNGNAGRGESFLRPGASTGHREFLGERKADRQRYVGACVF